MWGKRKSCQWVRGSSQAGWPGRSRNNGQLLLRADISLSLIYLSREGTQVDPVFTVVFPHSSFLPSSACLLSGPPPFFSGVRDNRVVSKVPPRHPCDCSRCRGVGSLVERGGYPVLGRVSLLLWPAPWGCRHWLLKPLRASNPTATNWVPFPPRAGL